MSCYHRRINNFVIHCEDVCGMKRHRQHEMINIIVWVCSSEDKEDVECEDRELLKQCDGFHALCPPPQPT